MSHRTLALVLASAQALTGAAAGAALLVMSAPPLTVARAAQPSLRITVSSSAPAVARVTVPTKVHRHPVTRVVSRRVVTPRPVARPVRRTARVVGPRVTAVPLTKLEQLNQAVARIPGHADPTVVWVLSTAYGSWGTADWYHGIVYISPNVPERRMYDVVIHEYSHLLSVVPYGGDVNQAVSAMNAYFGGSGLTGAERGADCMARLQGATWTNYTSCTDGHWRDGARRLVRGERL